MSPGARRSAYGTHSGESIAPSPGSRCTSLIVALRARGTRERVTAQCQPGYAVAVQPKEWVATRSPSITTPRCSPTVPGSAISSVPTWQPGGPVPEAGYTLPPGYAMFNGTSMAAPQTAGAVALLLSAADAGQLTVTPRQIRDSVYTSADFVEGVEAIGQGAGQVDVQGARHDLVFPNQ